MVCFFCANFSLLLMSVFIFFLSLNVVCCVLFFSALNRCFSYCLLSFACLDGLFYVICLSLPLITHFLYFFDVFLYALRVACLFFALLAVGSRVLTLFLPCLSKTELTGGLARAGAARRRWKSGFLPCAVFFGGWDWRSADYGLFFFCRVAAFLMERKRNCAGTVWRCLWGRALFACFFVWSAPAFDFGFCI